MSSDELRSIKIRDFCNSATNFSVVVNMVSSPSSSTFREVEFKPRKPQKKQESSRGRGEIEVIYLAKKSDATIARSARSASAAAASLRLLHLMALFALVV